MQSIAFQKYGTFILLVLRETSRRVTLLQIQVEYLYHNDIIN